MIVQNASSSTVPVASSTSISAPKPAVSRQAPVAAVSVTASAPHAQASNELLSKTVAVANETLSRSGSALQFSIDSVTDKTVVALVDKDTGEVIRQIPSEEAIAIARSIDEMLKQFAPSIGSGTLYQQLA